MEVEDGLFDVAVIGAGPAGSTLSALLAARSFRVALLDRDVFPRDKLCGEFLSYDALPLLEALGVRSTLEEAGATRISTCRVVGSRRTYSFPLPAEARGISRMALDAMLAGRAIGLGAVSFEGTTVESIESDSERSVIRGKRRDGSPVNISARVVAGAWGRWGRIDRQLGRAFVEDHQHRHFGFKRHYLATDRDDRSTIDLYAFGDGYLGVSAIENNRINICGLVHASRLEGNKGGWSGFVSRLIEDSQPLAALFQNHQPAQEEFLSSEPVIFAAKSAVERGIVMVGDASGLVDPLAGNGMAMGIQSAFSAATSLTGYLRGRFDRRSMEAEYERAFFDLFASRIRWSRRIARLLSRPRLLDRGLPLARSEGIGKFLVARTRASSAMVARLLQAWESAV
ncbi:MAG TPA: NAD(P)/FAD-dependent oxidoreductase [Thermoanaerobaculia bacterium]|nr:NAD(P)/FAD-dependent oxidoreductase [Thermoanaerobaculia bacterium]